MTLKGPQPIPGSKPIDILKHRSGMCAAPVKSVGLVHYVCGLRAQVGDYCEGHNPYTALGQTSKEFIRGLRRQLKE